MNNISPKSNYGANYHQNSPSFKANFVFTKSSATALREEMTTLAKKYPIKTLRKKNPLQKLLKQIKEMPNTENKKVKLYYEPPKCQGYSYVTGQAWYSDAQWVAECNGNKVYDAGIYLSEKNIPTRTPIQNLLKKIVECPNEFFGK